jgi:HK97 family phage major capsid protein/HK97 family phage prohead protease
MSTDSARRVRRALDGDRSVTVTRAHVFDDIHIRKGGTGRDVIAYAAVFNTPTEIVDQDGHYNEQNDPASFNRSLADRADQIFSVYNHAKSLDGTPSDMWSVPLGKPLEMKPDQRGLYTVTRFDPGPENDRILEAIKSQSLRGMSYTGVFVKSSPDKGRGQYMPDRNGDLALVTRQEIALIEYGPTPIPAFVTAEIMGVRAKELAAMGISPEQAMEIVNLNGQSRTGVPVHHTDVATTDYDPKAEIGKLKFPTSWDHMQSVYALADQAAGAGNGGNYMPEHGYLPHHHVNDDGTPGAANLIASRNALLKADSIEGFPTDSKQKAKAHLRAHIEDAGASAQADNKAYPAVVTGAAGMTSNSARDDDVEAERATAAPAADDMASPVPARDTTVATHGTHTGSHSHNHNAYDGPDDNGDGMHGHEHDHEGDALHDHDHDPGTSGRAGKGKKKKETEPDADDMGTPTGVAASKAGKFDPDKDGDDDSKASTDTDHDYWTADGKQKKPVPGKPMKDKEGRAAPDAAEPADDSHGSVDTSAWDAGKVWAAGSASNDPAKFYAAVCAGRRKGDPKLQATWGLPHHYKPGDPPNAHGVSNALGRLAGAQGLMNATAARAHLEAHERAIQAAKGDTKSSSSSGRKPAAAVPRNADASTGAAVKPGPQPHPAPPSTIKESETMEGLMSIDQRQARLMEVQHRLQEIDTENMGAELPADTRTEWTSLQQELIEHQRAIKDATARAQYLRTIVESGDEGAMEGIDNAGIGFPGVGFTPGGGQGGYGTTVRNAPAYVKDRLGTGPMFYNPMKPEQIFDLTAIRHKAHNFDEVPTLYREHAMRALDAVRYSGPKSREDCQETVANLLDRVDDEGGSLARRVLVTGSPLYDRAFGKMLGSLSVNGLNTEEQRALQLGVDSAGGFAVPFQLDPTVILSSNGAINPLRQISRVEQITGKEWDGVTSAGVVVNRVAEGTEAATGDPLLVQPNVRTTRVQGFVPFNIELDVSWGALRSQMTNLLMDAKDVEEATSFALGNGTAPNANGVIQTLHDSSPASLVNTAGTATLAIGDLYNLENQMAPRFRQQSAYLASKTTFNRFRQLFQALASAAFDSWVRPSAGTPATFNGYPAYELSTMTTAISSGSLVLLQGDFSQFLIVDRIGMGIELIPHLFGSTNRFPVGQRGILAIWFNNSRVLVPNAFRLLSTL